ncbi:MAG: AsmA family protein [Formivibrio sp.]|nr:AsmA family protein [Formivibrio sp.]
MKNISARTIFFIILISAVAVLPLVFPYNLVKNKLEARLNQTLHGKFNIGEIHFSYLPTPAFQLDQVTIDSADEASIRQIKIPVTPRNLLSFGRALHGVTLIEPVFSRNFALSLPDRLPQETAGPHIDKLVLDQASIKLEQSTLGPYSSELNFKANGQIEALNLNSPDGKVQLQIQPVSAGNFKVSFSAQNWQLPFAYPVNFEYINMVGLANSEALQITDIQAGLYNGLVTGHGQLLWKGAWQLSGQIQAKNIRAEPLIAVFSPVTRATGLLHGDGSFRFNASNYIQLFDTPQLLGHFTIMDGLIHNLDLITPLKSNSSEIVQHGGQTSFNLLRGTLGIQGKTVSLRGVHIEAGKFLANGELLVREGKLSGGAAATLSAGSIAVSNQASLSGTLAAPELRTGSAWRPTLGEDSVPTAP